MSKSFYFFNFDLDTAKLTSQKELLALACPTFSLIYCHKLITLLPFIFYLIYLNVRKTIIFTIIELVNFYLFTIVYLFCYKYLLIISN